MTVPIHGSEAFPERPGPPAWENPNRLVPPESLRAGWGYRAGATLVDIAISLVPGFLAGYVITDESSYASPVIFGIWILNVIVLASLNNGRTIGKLVAGTRIMHENGRPYRFGTALLRDFVCRLLFFIPFFFLVDSLMPLGSRRQSVRDRMVGTFVVKEPSYRARRWPLSAAAIAAVAGIGVTLAAAGAFDGDYSDYDRAQFVESCEEEGASRAGCECAWDNVSSQLTYEEYLEADRQDPEDWDPRVTRIIDQSFEGCPQ